MYSHSKADSHMLAGGSNGYGDSNHSNAHHNASVNNGSNHLLNQSLRSHIQAESIYGEA